MSDLKTIEKQIEDAHAMEVSLEKKLEKVTNEDQIASFKAQLEKLDALIKHLSAKRNEILKEQ